MTSRVGAAELEARWLRRVRVVGAIEMGMADREEEGEGEGLLSRLGIDGRRWKKARTSGRAGRENVLDCRGAVGSHSVLRPVVGEAAWMLCDVSGVPTGQH